jgi:hypothetical protein
MKRSVPTLLPAAAVEFRSQLLDLLERHAPFERFFYIDADTVVVVCPARADRSVRRHRPERGPRLPTRVRSGCDPGCTEGGPAMTATVTGKDLKPASPAQVSAPLTVTLLDGVEGILSRFVVLPSPEAMVAVQLFVLHTWAINAAYATPYLAVVSAERQSGKTKFLEVLELLVRNPWLTASASESALFRTIEADCPTLLLDEVDAIFGSNTDRTEPLRALLNAGNKRRTTVSRCVPPKFEARKFSTFCPKILSGIDTGKLPETITDRAITLHMKRRHAGEHVERLRYRFAEQDTEQLREELRVWGESATETLSASNPSLPDGLSDRAGDAWEPLLAIADTAGDHWGERARTAALALSGLTEDGELGRGAQLLGAIRAAMGDEHAIPSAELLEKINADEDLPFGGYRDGRGLDGRWLSRLLRPYGVKRATIRFGDTTAKGYRRESLADAWTRYLPAEAVTTGTSVTGGGSVAEKPSNGGAVTAVTAVTDTAVSNGHKPGVLPYELDESRTSPAAEALAAEYCHCGDPLRDADDDGEHCARCGRWVA